MTVKMTLDEALRETLDDHQMSKYEAAVIHELVLADGILDAHEKELLQTALHENHFDDKALKILQELILRADAIKQ